MRIFDLGKEEKGFSIGIDQNDIGDIKRIDRYQNIFYEGMYETKINNKKVIFHKIHFLEGDDDFKKYLFDELQNEKSNFIDVIEYISFIVRNYIKNKTIEKLIGDLGEVLFILHLEKNNIPWTNNYHCESNSLFDFSFDKYNIDIKTTTQNKKTIKISLNQLSYSKPIKFVVVQINKCENKKNIIELIDSVKNHNDVLTKIRKYWATFANNDSKFVNSYTADENDEVFVLDDDKIPKIEVKHWGNLKNAQFELTTTNNSVKYLDLKQLLLITDK